MTPLEPPQPAAPIGARRLRPRWPLVVAAIALLLVGGGAAAGGLHRSTSVALVLSTLVSPTASPIAPSPTAPAAPPITCAAEVLRVYALPPDAGIGTQSVDLLLQNTGADACRLTGYPTQVDGIGADGRTTNLHVQDGSSAADGGTLQPGGYAFIGIGGLNAFSCRNGSAEPLRPDAFTQLTLELHAGAGTVPVSVGEPYNFPCGPVLVTSFQPPPLLPPGLRVEPTQAATGATLTITGYVSSPQLCPLVHVTIAADAATGAGYSFTVQVRKPDPTPATTQRACQSEGACPVSAQHTWPRRCSGGARLVPHR